MKQILIFSILAFITIKASTAQELTNKRNETIKTESQEPLTIKLIKPDQFSFGFGIGLDNGGFGVSALHYLHKNVGIFAGAGYALIGPGLNAGLKIRVIGKEVNSVINPYFMGMYGYNAVVYIENESDYDKMFYGPTIGAGFDIRFNIQKHIYLSLGVLLPIRSSEVETYVDELEALGAEFKNELPPIGLSLSLRFGI